MQERLCRTKFSWSRCSHLAVQTFDCTGQKFDLDFCVEIFERLGVQICVRLAWFHMDGTPKGTYEFSTGRLACDQAVRPQSAPKSLLIG